MAYGFPMIRVTVSVGFYLFFTAVFQALSLKVPFGLNMIFLAPLIMVFSLQYFRLYETLVVALLCGAIVDIVGGYPIGYNMLVMFLGSMTLNVFKILSTRVQRNELVYYVMAFSLIYRLGIIIIDIMTQRNVNIQVASWILGPVLDGGVSIFLFPILVKVLSLVKVFDQNDYFRNRIGLSS